MFSGFPLSNTFSNSSGSKLARIAPIRLARTLSACSISNLASTPFISKSEVPDSELLTSFLLVTISTKFSSSELLPVSGLGPPVRPLVRGNSKFLLCSSVRLRTLTLSLISLNIFLFLPSPIRRSSFTPGSAPKNPFEACFKRSSCLVSSPVIVLSP